MHVCRQVMHAWHMYCAVGGDLRCAGSGQLGPCVQRQMEGTGCGIEGEACCAKLFTMPCQSMITDTHSSMLLCGPATCTLQSSCARCLPRFRLRYTQTMTFEVLEVEGTELPLGGMTFKQRQAILEAAVCASVDHPNIVSNPPDTVKSSAAGAGPLPHAALCCRCCSALAR